MPAKSIADDLKRALDSTDIFRRNKLTPDPWQQELLECKQSRYVIACSRQAGKSETIAALSVHKAGTRPGSTVLMLAPSQRQTQENIRRCTTLLHGAGYGKEAKVETQSLLHFKNGSRIIGLSSGANLRGFASDLICVDEAAFVDDETLQETMPMLATRPGAVFIACSTPNGARGFFFRHFTDESNGWVKIRVTADEVPRISSQFLEQQRRELGELAYQQEYFCSFVSDGSRLIHDDFFAGKFKSFGIF